MNKPSQDFRFDKTHYQRPTQKWVCGWASEGRSCRIGPDRKGGCQAAYTCFPVRAEDRWMCARSPNEGGACEDGPGSDGTCCLAIPPCQPVRSIRARRNLVAALVTAITLSLLLIFLAEPRLNIPTHSFTSPGPLAAPHSSVTDCASCHMAAQKQTIGALLTTDTRIADSKQCQSCHSNDAGLMPHGLPSSELAPVTDRMKALKSGARLTSQAAVAAGFMVHPNKQGELACVSCHLEHQGVNVRLTNMPVQGCQSCHVNQFASFTEGHPEFTSNASRVVEHLPFNHVHHEKEYFATKGITFACLNCHVTGPDGRNTLTQSFEKTCAGCHLDQIQRGTGVAVFRLPGIDFDTLLDHDIDIGEWPADANLDMEEDLTPFMTLLLSADARVARDLRALAKADLHLYDLEKADKAQIAAAGRVIWAVKDLYADLINQGQAKLAARLTKVIGSALNQRDLLAVTGQGLGEPEWLAPVKQPQWLTRLQRAQQSWLPSLLTEIPLYKNGQPPKLKELKLKFKDQGDFDRENPRGGWYTVDRAYTIYYRPGGHLDPFIQTWIDKSGATAGMEAGDLFNTLTSTSAEAPGQCMKCHRLAGGEGMKARQVVWSEEQSPFRMEKVSLFAHASHVKLKDCQTCHALDAERNFKPMVKATCGECHNSKIAGDSCFTCHTYHIGAWTMAANPSSPHASVSGTP